MYHKGEGFTDVFAQRDNFVSKIEVRTKIAFTIIALVLNLLSPTIYTPLSIAAFCLIMLLATKVPPKTLLLRLAMPLVMAVIVLITQIFFYGTSPLFNLSFWGFRLVGYEEGLAHGFLIMSRVIGGVSLILFLSMSTPAPRLLLAAGWFKVPKIFIELALLIYRYIFVLLEEVVAIRDAQRVRLGYHNWRQSMKSLGTLGGILILHAYDRAARVFDAMLARGYTNSIPINYHQRLSKKDYLTASGLAASLVVFYLTGQWKL